MKSFRKFLIENSNSDLSALYQRINRVAFNNELPNIKPVFSSRLSRATGLAKARHRNNILIGEPSITISDKYFMDQETLEIILAHEMIHVYFYVNGNFEENHGSLFRHKANEIGRKLGKQIPLTHDTRGLKIARPPEKAGVVLFIRPNNIAGTFFKPTSFQRQKDDIRAWAHIMKDRIMRSENMEIRMFTSETMAAHFFPKSTSSRSSKIYKITQDEHIRELLSIKQYEKI